MRQHFKSLRQLKRVSELTQCIAATTEWPTVTRYYLSKQSARFPFVFCTRKGYELVVRDWDELTTVWHVYCAQEYALPATVRTILGLGANIGAFTIWAAEQLPAARIFAVEPFPSTFERLVQHVERNALGDRVRSAEIAVSDRDGLAEFDATVGKRSYCRALKASAENGSTISVQSLSLESLLNRFDLPTVDCLKMDVEGGEYAIIGGASPSTLRRAKLITMEFHDAARADCLWSALESSGFRRTRYACNGWSGLATYERVD